MVDWGTNGELTIKKDSRTNSAKRTLRYAGRGVEYYKTEEISSKSSRKILMQHVLGKLGG